MIPPELAQTAQLIRITIDHGTEANNFRGRVTEQAPVPIVVSTAPTTPGRHEDVTDAGIRTEGSRTFYTVEELRPARAGHAADVLLWHGQRYRVSVVRDYGGVPLQFREVVCSLEPADGRSR